MHNTINPNVKLFAGDFSVVFMWYLNKQGVQHCAINLLLYLWMIREKYVKCIKISSCSYVCM